MIDPGTRVLVADDQLDVARALLAGLGRSPARIKWVSNGDDAITEILGSGSVYDLAIVDMKMPPGVWGGLEVIRRLRDAGNGTPVVVMSGEAGQAQTIQALRMGATDWIAKDEATTTAVDRVGQVLVQLSDDAIREPSAELPLPIAIAVENWQIALLRRDPVGSDVALFHALETIWRICACVGLSGLGPTQRIDGLRLDQLVQPSMGTILELLRRVTAGTKGGTPTRALLNCVVDDNPIGLVTARNDGIGHPSSVPGIQVRDSDRARGQLAGFLRRFRRSRPGVLARPGNMRFTNGHFLTEMVPLTRSPVSGVTVISDSPIEYGQAYWVAGEDRATRCWPWLVLDPVEPSHGSPVAVLSFDGVKVKRRDYSNDATPFIYVGGANKMSVPSGGTMLNVRCLLQ